MLTTGNAVFLQLPEETQQRVLHPGVVLGLDEAGYRTGFVEPDIAVQPGQEVLVYFTRGREFVKQAARIESVEAGDLDNDVADPSDENAHGLTLLVSVSGEPVSAESRQCFRVSTVIADHVVQVDGGTCKLLDVSFTGFAAETDRVYEIGRILEAAVSVNGESVTGRVCVQSIKEQPSGLTRYGLYCSDERDAEGGFKNGLQKLSMAIQREQLNRLAGV